jgi:hypothetical protein
MNGININEPFRWHESDRKEIERLPEPKVDASSFRRLPEIDRAVAKALTRRRSNGLLKQSRIGRFVDRILGMP